MKEAPNMISSKDLLYIEDMMNWNYTFVQNLKVLAELVCDEEVLEIFNKVKKMHVKHFKELLGILD